MKNKESLNKTLSLSADSLLPGISVDCVIFGFHSGTMKILLNKFSFYTLWMVPGGFIFKDENIHDAAYRILTSRTGLSNIYLQQFHTFGKHTRTDISENENMLKKTGFPEEEHKTHWILQRFISIGYYALVDYSKVKIFTNPDEEIAWFDLDDIPQLYSDHNHIVEKALLTIREQLSYIPIGYELLPKKFTMTELRIIYETILKRKLDRRNFQRKMLSTGLINKLNEVSKKPGIKTTSLFSFDEEKYNDARKNGLFLLT